MLGKNKNFVVGKKQNSRFKPFSATLLFLSILLLPLFSAGFVSGYLPHKLNTELSIVTSSNNATLCNLSYITHPNGSKNYLNLKMTKNVNSFNRTLNLNNFTKIGTACIGLICTDGVREVTGSICRDVTYTGDVITSEQTSVYIIALIFLVLLILGLVFIISTLPGSDAIDERGIIIQISWLKYLRPVIWGIIWALGLACLFIISNLGLAHLPNNMVGNLFFVLFRMMFYVTIIMTPLYLIWIFYRIFKDKEFKRMMKRGAEFRGMP